MLDARLIELAGDPAATKAIATTDPHGVPHIAPAPWLRLTDEGEFVHPELHLASISNQNLMHSLWFNRMIAISIAGQKLQQWHITGIPVKLTCAGQCSEGSMNSSATSLAMWILSRSISSSPLKCGGI